ncbi:MAG: MFS transporter [Candidatus Bathyarchaeia archaeon]
MNFAAPIPQTYASLYFKGLGADDFILSVIGFSGTIAIALVQFPGGYLADRHGRRWLVFTMTFGVALSYFFYIIAPTWQFIVIGAMMQNFCLLYQPALFAIMLDSVAPENRGAGFTFQSVVTNLASIPASLIAGFLVLTLELDIGMRIAYTIVMVFFFVAAILRVKLKETLPQNSGNTRPNFLNALREYPKAVKEGLQVWKQVPKATFYLFIASSGMSSLLISCYIYFVVYAVEILKLQQFQWALVMAFTSMSIAIPTIIAGQKMDRTGRKHPLIIGFLLYIPAMLIFLNANSTTIFAAFFFFGLGQTLHWTSYQSLIGDLTPRNLRGKVVGCSQFFMYISQALIQLVIGALYAYVSPQLPFLLLAACSIPFSLLVFFKVFDPKTKEI